MAGPAATFPWTAAETPSGLKFTSSLGPITIQHQVEVANDHCLRMILSQGIDGFHEWYWGDGWVQSRLEGVFAAAVKSGSNSQFMAFARGVDGCQGCKD